MQNKLIKKIVQAIEKYTEWKITLTKKSSTKRLTAVKSDIGFWYSGDLLSESDIAYGILRNGKVEVDETNLVLKILEKISTSSITFYDVGANSGYYGILAAYVGKNSVSTFSFEPLEEYVNLIKQSASLNHLEHNITVLNTALGNSNTTGIINVAGSGSSLVPNFNDNITLPTREIMIKKLDTLLEEKSLPLPDFVKIDVEGYEYEVLLGAQTTITESRPILFIEIASTLKKLQRDFKNENTEKIFDLLHSLGYNAYVVKDGIFSVDSACKDDGVFMYLFLNKDNPLHKTLVNVVKT